MAIIKCREISGSRFKKKKQQPASRDGNRAPIRTMTYGRVLPGVLLSGVLAQRPAPVQLYVKLVIVASGAVDVHAVRVVRISGRVQQTAERAVETDPDFHVVVLALGFDICETKRRERRESLVTVGYVVVIKISDRIVIKKI